MNDSEKCQEMATIRRFWPGKEPDLVCFDHAHDTQQIAKAMGIYIYLEPILYPVGEPIVTEFPTCCCSKGFSQTIVIE